MLLQHSTLAFPGKGLTDVSSFSFEMPPQATHGLGWPITDHAAGHV